MLKATIYSLLITTMFALLPLSTTGAPQSVDINKPTRERVKDKDKKKENKKEVKKEENKDDKKVVQDDKKQEVAKPAGDTASKKVEPPKPKKIPMHPDRVQFDGIDVSKHQGVINWTELRKHDKIQYVYIRATVGSNVTDSRYKENLHNARKHGFKVGSYHYFTNLSSATAQFENFKNIAVREEQDLIPIIDVEERRWSKQQLRDSVMVFANLIEDYYGCKPLIYTNEKFFTSNLGRAFADFPLFIAKYSSAQPNIGYKWVLWQFSDCGQFKGAVKGNHGEVDMSRFNKGCSINDIIYHPSKHKPRRASVRDAVDHKEKPTSVNMTEHKSKETPAMSKKQKEEAKKKAQKEQKAKERSKRLAEEEAKKKAEADRKAKAKAEQQKREKEEQQAKEAAKKKEQQAREAAKKKELEAKKKEQEAKEKRKAEAKKARQAKAQQNAANKSSNKSASLLQNSSSKLSQSQRNDSIRAAKNKGLKTNKSSADND